MRPRVDDGASEHGPAQDKSQGPAQDKPESDWGLTPPKRRSGFETKLAVVVIVGLLGAFGWLVYQKVQARQLALKNGELEQVEGTSAEGEPNTVEETLARAEPTLSATEEDPFATPAGGTRAEQAEADNPFTADAAAAANAKRKVAQAEETLLEANQEVANDEFALNRDVAMTQQAKESVAREKQELMEAQQELANDEFALNEAPAVTQRAQQKVARVEEELMESQQELANDEFALNEDRAATTQAKQKAAQAQEDLMEAQQELSNDEFVLNEDRAAARKAMQRPADSAPVTGDLEDAFDADANARAAIVPESVERLPAEQSRISELAEEVETDAVRAGKAAEKAIVRAPERAVEAVESLFGGEPAAVTPPTRVEIREERAAIREERAQVRQEERARIQEEEDRYGGYEPIPEGNETAEARIEIVRPEPKKLTMVERVEKRVGRAVGAAELGIRNEIRALEGKPAVAGSVTTVERPIAEPVIMPRSVPVVSERMPAAIDVNEFDDEVPARRTGIRQTGIAAEQGLEALDSHAGGVYVVQPNDNYWKISRKVYGTGRYYNALARHNQQRVPDPKQMRPGLKIATPPKDQLERHYPDLLRNSAAAPENHEPTGYFVTKAGHPMYRIGSEDTLSGIAQQCLGRSSRWTEILQMNRDRLRNPDDLKIGLELRLPTDASQARIVNNPGERF